jgi:hypothetical protein
LRVIFSRKGFDSQAGKVPSPIVKGRPVSLPIPTAKQTRSHTSFKDLDSGGLNYGALVEEVTRGRIKGDHLCHEDPMFDGRGRCLFGQCGAPQTHLRNQGVTIGDVFLFFGLFAGGTPPERHHRIFGYLKVDTIFEAPTDAWALRKTGQFRHPHPHTLGEWPANNTVYAGIGRTARSAHDTLRLTQPGGPLTRWVVPSWLKNCGLSFHQRPERWFAAARLEIVDLGQEFVANIGDDAACREWLNTVIGAVEA